MTAPRPAPLAIAEAARELLATLRPVSASEAREAAPPVAAAVKRVEETRAEKEKPAA